MLEAVLLGVVDGTLGVSLGCRRKDDRLCVRFTFGMWVENAGAVLREWANVGSERSGEEAVWAGKETFWMVRRRSQEVQVGEVATAIGAISEGEAKIRCSGRRIAWSD